MKCPKCNGTGTLTYIFNLQDYKPFLGFCYFCNGRGEVDWIENIFGVSDERFPILRVKEPQ